MVTQWLKLLIFIKWKWKSLSHVWLFATPWTIQSKILEWVAFPFSRGSSQPSDWMQVSHTAGRFFTSWATGKPKNTGVGSLSLLQWIFPTQELNWVLLHCRWIFTIWATREVQEYVTSKCHLASHAGREAKSGRFSYTLTLQAFVNWGLLILPYFQHLLVEKKVLRWSHSGWRGTTWTAGAMAR